MVYFFPKHGGEDDGDTVRGRRDVNGFFFAVVDCCEVGCICGWSSVGAFEGFGGCFVEVGMGGEGFFEGCCEGVSLD